MALRDWIGRLRGKGGPAEGQPAEEEAPPSGTPAGDTGYQPAEPPGPLPDGGALTTPPGQPPEPVPPSGAPTLPASAAPDILVPPLPPAPSPYAAPAPIERLSAEPAPAVSYAPPVDAVPPRDDAAALREAEAWTEPEPASSEAATPEPAMPEPAARRGWLSRLLPGRPGEAAPVAAPEEAAEPAPAAPEMRAAPVAPAPQAPPPATDVAAAVPDAAPAEPSPVLARAPVIEPTPAPEAEPAPPAEDEAEPAAPRGTGGWLARFRGGTTAPHEAAPPAATPEAEPPAPAAEPAEALAAAEPEPDQAARGGWFSRLRAGLSRSTARLTESVTALFARRRLDEEALEELEETLITADLGVAASRRIVEGFRRTRFGKEVTDEEVKAALAEEIAEILAPVALPMEIAPERAPHVVLVVGVNGTGKTTTIAKLGQQYRAQGLSCAFVAGDTFRAAAVEQLQIWGERTGAHVYTPAKQGADAAGLAFDALKAAREAGTDVLLVDTAGRLHNKTALMEELRKVVRIIRRVDETAPHSVLLTLDATTGQNALQQAKVFKEMVDVTGLAVTKLDGSAKGGVVVALAQEFGLPVHMVGVGEKADDLRPFEARDFARGLVGLD